MGEKQNGEDQAGQKSGSVPKVRWDDSNMQTSYANVANVTSSREEVTFFFGTNRTWNASDKEFTILLSDRLILKPYAAKRLSRLLNAVLKEYESRYGTLEIDKREQQQAT
ncbi:MAG: DUF3467 domain-containing protein [Alphaproteobacteria bacterium]